MSGTELLADLIRRGVQLRADGDQLIVRAPKDTPIQRGLLTEHKAEILALLRDASGESMFLSSPSHGQKALWFVYQLAPKSTAYNIAYIARICSELDISALRHAFQKLIDRHSCLRTTYMVIDGELAQLTRDHMNVHFAITDTSNWSCDELKHRMDKEADRPFDLELGPVLRVNLFARSAREHFVLLTIHHITFDYFSLDVLMNELRTLYNAENRDLQATLPPLRLQYPDYVRWQTEMLAGPRGAQLWGYWQKQLSGELPVLNFPTDRPRPAVQTYRGATESFTLTEQLTQKLRGLSKAEGTTLYMTLLAVFQVLLYRYTAQEDILVGSPTAGRSHAEFLPIIGYFVNPVVLRVDVSGSLTFRAFLRRVAGIVLGALEHSDYPFALLVQQLQPVRDSSRSPLFQVAFAWNAVNPNPGPHDVSPSLGPEEAASPPNSSTLEIEMVAGGQRGADFDLVLTINEQGKTLSVEWRYNTDLFDAATIERIRDHFNVLLESIVAHPDRRISELAILTEAQRRQVLLEWNDTERDYPKDKCIHELFEAQVQKAPNAVGVVFEGKQLTYWELNQRANQLAHYLKKLGVGPEVVVGLCIERSIEMVVALLGIVKAGGAYVPLDPEYPASRLAFMLEDTAAPVLLAQAKLRERLPAYAGRVLALDADWAEIARESEDNPKVAFGAHNLAYVIYTSGSTGQPKGTCIEHRSVVRLVKNTNYIELGPGEVFLQFAPISFDASTLELWGPLLNGAKLVVCPAGLLSLEELGRVIRERGVTTLWLTAPLFHQMVDTQIESLRGVHQLLAGGEILSVPHVRRMLEVIGEGRLINGYGPTENTTFTCCHVMKEDSRIENSVPIGRPISNTRVYVLDAHRQPVPVGVYGELYIGGDGLAREYLHQPELTAEKFIADPFDTSPGARLYRTGDLVRYLPDGNIEFLGRVDHQVKIRGFRIELAEIEAVFDKHPAVRQSVVVAREDSPGDKRLVAYVVPQDGQADALTGLRGFLKRSLPEYMVPSAFVTLDKLPLTPNGKVDRRALLAPERSVYDEARFVAPRTPTEEILAGIWADVLGLERVGIHDNFFELGGHSLLAVSVIERIRRAGLHADVRTLFATSTIAALAAAVGGDSGIVEVPPNLIPPVCEAITPEMLPLVQLKPEEIEHVVGAVPGGAANIQDIYPLAPLQEGILFHHLMASEGDPYLLHALLGFDTRARLENYLQALQAVIERHDMLRTAVVWEGLSEPVQVVWRRAVLRVEEVSLDPGGGDVAEQLRARFDRYRLDVREAPLLRIFIAEDRANARWVMLLLFHHLVSDHTALEVMQQEIQVHLLGRAKELPAPLPFRNFVAQARLGVSHEEHEAYFKKLLGDVEELTAPFGLSDVQGDGSGIAEARLPVDASLGRRLRERGRALGVSAASICHLAWAQVLARTSGRDDVVFGTVLFGRMQVGEGAERVLGLFINTLPVRIRVGEEGVQESVRHAHAQLAQLLRHEHASLALAQRCSAVAAPAPLFSALLNYRHSAPAAQVSAEAGQVLEGMQFLGGEERTNYPFMLSVDDLGESFALTAQVQSPIDPARICAYMHTALEQLVAALESTPATPVCSLDVLPEAERCQVVEAWNRTGREYGREARLHRLIEQQVAQTPQSVALEFEGQELSYSELNRRANQLARVLRGRGVGTDVLVGVLAERSFEMVVALLAVLKAGGAYVPLDPSYPAERLGHMLEDARASMVLAQPHLVGRLPAQGGEVLLLDGSWAAYASEAGEDLKDLGTPRDLAYVIFTSGSTGRPKGAMNEHRGICNRLLWMQGEYGLTGADRVLQKTPFSFDVSVWEFFWPLMTGARLVIARPEGHRDSAYLVRLIQENRITTLHFVPSMMRAFLEEEALEACGSLKRVICSGEALSHELQERFFKRLPGVELLNLYGPTEAAVDVTYWACRRGDERHTVPIGLPVANTQMYVLDPRLEPVPVGVSGELYIGGVQVGRGYVGRNDLTAERFVPDPFSNTSGARLYKTGDRARHLSDGAIEYLGRLDYQVKIRGFRIELGEIEVALSQHHAMREVVVVAHKDGKAETRLIAYVVLIQNSVFSVGEMRGFLKLRLPEYMIPSGFVFLSQIPLTSNGKVDRKALDAANTDAAIRSENFVTPRNPAEQRIAEIYAQVLKLDSVGIHDNFFELGGHSLLATQVISRVRRAFELELPVRVLYEKPTIEELALTVEEILTDEIASQT